MNIALTIINSLAILLVAFLFYKKCGTEYPKLFWVSLSLKVAGGCALGLVYLYYYSNSDTWTFFKEASRQADLASGDMGGYLNYLFSINSSSNISHPLYFADRNSILIKFISLLCLISGNNYWICASYFSIISFACAWYLFSQLVKYLPSASLASAIALFFFPSIIFWSSGIIKETFALAGIYLITAIFIQYAFKASLKWNHIFMGLMALLAVWILKYYWLAIYLWILIPSVITVYASRRGSFPKYIWSISGLLVAILTTLIHPNFYLSRIVEVIVSNNESFLAASDSKNVINFYQLQPTWWSVALNSPWAVISGLFRPFVWEASNWPVILASLENSILTMLSVSLILNFSKYKNKEIFIAVLSFSIILCAFLALSTPNLGTLSRYRMGFLPFYIFAIVYQNSLVEYFSKLFGFFKN